MEFRAGLNPLKEREDYLCRQSNHHSCSVCFIYGLFGDVTSSLVCMILCKISEKLIGEAVEESGRGLIDGPFPELPRGTEKNYEFP